MYLAFLNKATLRGIIFFYILFCVRYAPSPKLFSNRSTFFRKARDFQIKARSLEWRKNCFSRGTFDLPHQRVLNFGMGLEWRSGARTKRFHELNSASGCRKVRKNSREGERGGVATAEKKGREEQRSSRRCGGGVAIWFRNLDKESFLPRYWLLRVWTSSLLKLERISRCAMEQPWG